MPLAELMTAGAQVALQAWDRERSDALWSGDSGLRGFGVGPAHRAPRKRAVGLRDGLSRCDRIVATAEMIDLRLQVRHIARGSEPQLLCRDGGKLRQRSQYKTGPTVSTCYWPK